MKNIKERLTSFLAVLVYPSNIFFSEMKLTIELVELLIIALMTMDLKRNQIADKNQFKINEGSSLNKKLDP